MNERWVAIGFSENDPYPEVTPFRFAGTTPATVSRWLNEKRPIPTTVERLIACLDANPERAEE